MEQLVLHLCLLKKKKTKPKNKCKNNPKAQKKKKKKERFLLRRSIPNMKKTETKTSHTQQKNC